MLLMKIVMITHHQVFRREILGIHDIVQTQFETLIQAHLRNSF